MKELQFLVEINASKEKVWNTLWNDNTYRIWANNIDEGTYMIGEMKEGESVQFISSESGYGVTSIVSKLIPLETVTFKHMMDTMDSGKEEREEEWTGGAESYFLEETEGVTTLKVKMDTPSGQIETFNTLFPKALDSIKALSEINNEILNYNSELFKDDENICNILMVEINKYLKNSNSKIWHGSPVWFIDENPIVGYCKLKSCIQLLFWSGQTFAEEELKSIGKYKAAEVRYNSVEQIDTEKLEVWLKKSIDIQWDYKNIVKRKGVLERF